MGTVYTWYCYPAIPAVTHSLRNLVQFYKFVWKSSLSILKTCGATRNPEFPWTGPDRSETGPGSGNIFKNIFGSGRVGEFYFWSVRVGEFYFGSVRSGYFLTGVGNIFSRDFGDKLAFYSQTVEVEWLLSLISTLFDVITSLQGIFTCFWSLKLDLKHKSLISTQNIFHVPQNFRVGPGRNMFISGWCWIVSVRSGPGKI